jgi:hypothetical protein
MRLPHIVIVATRHNYLGSVEVDSLGWGLLGFDDYPALLTSP